MRERIAICIIALAACARSAGAQLDPFEFEVYPARTVGHGMLEVESLNSYVADGHTQGDEGTSGGTFPSNLMYRTALEVTYGLTDKIEFAAYINVAKPNGAPLQYAGSKYRLRGSLFEPGQLWVDLGWYIELEWNQVPAFDAADLELELKPIIQKDIGPVEIDLNPKFDKVLVGSESGEGFEFGYIAGVYYNYLSWFSPGLEFYGAIGQMGDPEPLAEQQHYIFPVARGEFSNGIEYSFGPGFGLTSNSDQVLVKLNIEFERYLGTLF
jgi:hypothetical protein